MKLKIKDIGTVIAERELTGRDSDERPCQITIKIGKPFPDDEQEGCWYCPYSISKGSEQRLFYGAGVDSLQALRIAIGMVEADLTGRYSDLKLEWMGQLDLGLTGKV